MEPKYPSIEVQLSGADGNAFSIIGAVTKALRRNGVDRDTINQFSQEAMSSDYDNVIQTAMKWVQVS